MSRSSNSGNAAEGVLGMSHPPIPPNCPPLPPNNPMFENHFGTAYFKPGYIGLFKSIDICQDTGRSRQIIAAVARCAWLDEAERLHQFVGLDFSRWDEDFQTWHNAISNARAWVEWGRNEPQKHNELPSVHAPLDETPGGGIRVQETTAGQECIGNI